MLKRLLCLLLVPLSAQAMDFENRFLPLFFKPLTRLPGVCTYIRMQPFFMRADRAFSLEEKHSIADIEGPYDTISIVNALVATGHPNPLRSDLLTKSSIPWHRRGRLDAEGLALYFEQGLGDYFSVGFDTYFGHVSSRYEFLLEGSEQNLPPGDKEYLLELKEKINRELGLVPALFSKTGLGDIDFYIRIGSLCCYTWKFRRIDSGLKVGVIIPTASETPINNPAALPLGGEKHWGAYLNLESEFEVKEDVNVGLIFRASKRFKKTRTLHMPAAGEPSNYGAIIGPLEIDPGWTFVFNPYISFEGLREGFGLKAQYTLVSHFRDGLIDRRSLEAQTAVPALLDPVRARSSWASEYVTFGAFYDFSATKECPTWYPKIFAYWDIPVEWLVSKRSAKTNALSLMLELDF